MRGRVSDEGIVGVALSPALVVPCEPPPTTPLRVVELRDHMEPAPKHIFDSKNKKKSKYLLKKKN